MKWLAYPLHPEIPEEGVSLQDLFAGRAADSQSMALRLRRAAEEAGLPLGSIDRVFNTRLAQELAKWAEGQGKGDEYHRAAFTAYFVDGRNIGKVDELVALAASIGLAPDEARRVVERRLFREAVDADWRRSRELGITGVPTFLMADQRVVGAHPYDILERFVRECGAAKKRL